MAWSALPNEGSPFAFDNIAATWDSLPASFKAAAEPKSLFKPLQPESQSRPSRAYDEATDDTDRLLVSLLELAELDILSNNSRCDLDLPELATFEDEPPPALEDIPALSTASSSDIGYGDAYGELEDVWQLKHEEDTINDLLSELETAEDNEPNPAFLPVFELRTDELKRYDGSGRRAGSDRLVASLLLLGLGRSSSMFVLNADQSGFDKSMQERSTVQQDRGLANVVATFQALGKAVLEIHRYAMVISVESEQGTASHASNSATAEVASSILIAIEEHACAKHSPIVTLDQLQTAFTRIGELVHTMKEYLDACRSSTSNGATATQAYRFMQQQRKEDDLQDVISHAFARVTQPWLEDLERTIGLRSGDALFSEKSSSEEAQDWRETAKPLMPDFLTVELRDQIDECNGHFNYLQNLHPDHPLCSTASQHCGPRFEPAFTAEDIDRVARTALRYEANMKQAIEDHCICSNTQDSKRDEFSRSCYGPSISQNANHQPISSLSSYESTNPSHDNLRDALMIYLDNQATPGSMSKSQAFADLSLVPLLQVQHSLLTHAVVSSLFVNHSLLTHLDLHHSISLFNSGAFSSRLSDALFDTDHTSPNKNASLTSNTHLRLILSDVCKSTWQEIRPAHVSSRASLPGNLTLTLPAMISTFRQNPFVASQLHISYTPPQPLAQIFTPATDVLYSLIFRQLLRVHYARWTLEHLFLHAKSQRPARSRAAVVFRLHAQHLLTTVLHHFLSVGVNGPWSAFMQHARPSRGTRTTPATLAARHVAALEATAAALLLRDPQRRAHDALRRVCDGVLEFAAYAAAEAADVAVLYETWVCCAAAFVGECRGLVERGRGDGLGELVRALGDAGDGRGRDVSIGVRGRLEEELDASDWFED